MKKLIAFLLAMLMLLSLAACGAKEEKPADANQEKEQPAATPVITPSALPLEEQTPKETPIPAETSEESVDIGELVGIWRSHKVTNGLEEDVSEKMTPDALTMQFYADGKYEIAVGEDQIKGENWDAYQDSLWLRDSEREIYFQFADGFLFVDYYNEESEGFYFTCEKVS